VFKRINVRWKMSWRALFASAILVFGLSGNAHAHAIGVGEIVDGNNVSIWMSTWHDTVGGNQGSVEITGPGGFSATEAFDLLVAGSTPAAGWSGYDFEASPCLVADCAPDWWQGVAVSGLSPGTYNYVLSGTFTGEWNPDGQCGGSACQASDYQGSFAVTPIPAALPLLLSGLAAFGFFAHRRRSEAAA
jgi:hypothetical protein